MLYILKLPLKLFLKLAAFCSLDWITEDLLSKIEKNPQLMKQLEDPRFSQALSAFQANPQKALLAVQNDSEVKEFIQEFCGLLGEHFTTLGEEETKRVIFIRRKDYSNAKSVTSFLHYITKRITSAFP